MFGQGDTQQERQSILKTTDSLLDYVRESTSHPEQEARCGRSRSRERLPGFRAEIELRVQKIEQNAHSLGDLPGAPLGPPEDFGELLGVQFEMLALAWQTNRTKVATLKMVEEASMRTYPNLDVHEAFHPTSHWGGFPDRVANLRKIQNYHTAVFAKFVERLKGMREGDGSVLDHSIILFGSNMANSDAHNNDPLPQALIGRGGGIKGNQHLHYKQDTPHANILVTMLDRSGDPDERDRKVRRHHRRVHGSVMMRGSVGRVLLCRPAGILIVIAALATTLPAYGQTARRGRSFRLRQGYCGQVRSAIAGQTRRQPAATRRQHAAAMGRLQRRRGRGPATAARRRERVARQPLRRHADEPRRRSRQHRHAEGVARGRRERRITQCRRTDRAPGGGENRQRRGRAGCCWTHGAKVDAKEKFGGQTPLMWASARRHPAMMQLLIAKGADVNAASTTATTSVT
jgi:hypothetical protein